MFLTSIWAFLGSRKAPSRDWTFPGREAHFFVTEVANCSCRKTGRGRGGKPTFAAGVSRAWVGRCLRVGREPGAAAGKVRNHLVECLIIKSSTAVLAAVLQPASDIEQTMITHFRARTATQPRARHGEALSVHPGHHHLSENHYARLSLTSDTASRRARRRPCCGR